MQRTVEELCLAPGQTLPPFMDVRDTPTPVPPVAGSSRETSRTPSEFIVIDDDDEDEEDEIRNHIGTSRDAGTSTSTVAEPVDPLVNRTIDEIEKDKHEFGLSRFAISERILAERADIDELLSMLSLDELKTLGKELRVSNKATTRSALIQAIKLNASNQSTLTSMFAAGAAKVEAKKAAMRARKGKGRASDAAPAPVAAPGGDGTRSPPATSQTQLVIQKSTSTSLHLGPVLLIGSV